MANLGAIVDTTNLTDADWAEIDKGFSKALDELADRDPVRTRCAGGIDALAPEFEAAAAVRAEARRTAGADHGHERARYAKAAEVLELVDVLEQDDDVQKVFHNLA